MSVISFIWGILQFTVGVLTLITGTVALDSMTLRYQISFAHCIFKMKWFVNLKKKVPTVLVNKRSQFGKIEAKNESSMERSLEYERHFEANQKGYFEGTPLCTSLGLMLLITGIVGKLFMTPRFDTIFWLFNSKINIFIWPESDRCPPL